MIRMSTSRLTEWLILAATLLCATASLACWFVYFTVYWPYRSLFDDTGRYFDAQNAVMHHAQSGLLIWPAVALSGLTVLIGFAWRTVRNPSTHNTPQ